jgi:hypothetical protein
MVEIARKGDTVCIVGLSPSSRDGVLDEPAGVEIWSLNQGHAFMPELADRATRWFQVHPYEEMVARQRPEFGHLEWLREAKIPVYMEEVSPDVPMSVRYPYEDVCLDLSGVYLTSAVAFMIALAIHEKFTLIKLYGVEMASGTEYADQRPCVEYLLGQAIGRGIKIWLPLGCPLLAGASYAKTVMVPTSHIEKRMRELMNAASLRKDKSLELAGKIAFCRQLIEGPWAGAGKPLFGSPAAFLKETLQVLLQEERGVLSEYHQCVGSVKMCEDLLQTALRGAPERSPDDLVQSVDGLVHFGQGDARLYSKPDDDHKWHPENLPAMDISERAESIVQAHNQKVRVAGTNA